MSDLAKQLEDLRQASQRRHIETLAKMEALRADYKADFVRVTRTTDRLGNALLEIVDIVKELREDLDRVSLRSQAQMEGLESVLRVEMNEVQKDLTIVSGVVTSHLNHSAQINEDHEERLRRIERDRPPAA